MQGHLKINIDLFSALCPPQLHKTYGNKLQICTMATKYCLHGMTNNNIVSNVRTYNICMNAMYRNLKSGKMHYGQKLKCVHKVLKGLSQEMDLAFEYMHGQF
jgi:predicted aldo/keto reductase-like oxidoreductase